MLPGQRFVELQALACRVELAGSFPAALLEEEPLAEVVVRGVVAASQEVAQGLADPQVVRVEVGVEPA